MTQAKTQAKTEVARFPDMKQITNNDHKSRGLSRRSFLATTATVTSFMALPAHVLGLDGATSPNSKLNIAGIGI